MVYYYKYKDKYLFSFIKYNNLEAVAEEEVKEKSRKIYFLKKTPPLLSRRSFLVTSPHLLFIDKEGGSATTRRQ